MDHVENDLLVATVILQMLEEQKHIWSNSLAHAQSIRHDDDAERIRLVLDSIETEIARQREQIKFIGNFMIRPQN